MRKIFTHLWSIPEPLQALGLEGSHQQAFRCILSIDMPLSAEPEQGCTCYNKKTPCSISFLLEGLQSGVVLSTALWAKSGHSFSGNPKSYLVVGRE